MSDIALIYDLISADVRITNNDLEGDEGLETAVLLSLFTDRRANDNDIIPDGTSDKRGCWFDQFSVADNDLHGSRLWLLSREKQLQIVLEKAKDYTEECLKWMIEDRVTDTIIVVTEALKPDVLSISISIARPKKNFAEFRFDYNWQGQAAKTLL